MSNRSPRIERGAAVLDQNAPGWETKISLDHLDLANASYCVLGQVYGDYDNGLRELDGEVETHPARYGFLAQGDEDYDSLTDKWRAFIARRLGRRFAA